MPCFKDGLRQTRACHVGICPAPYFIQDSVIFFNSLHGRFTGLLSEHSFGLILKLSC